MAINAGEMSAPPSTEIGSSGIFPMVFIFHRDSVYFYGVLCWSLLFWSIFPSLVCCKRFGVLCWVDRSDWYIIIFFRCSQSPFLFGRTEKIQLPFMKIRLMVGSIAGESISLKSFHCTLNYAKGSKCRL